MNKKVINVKRKILEDWNYHSRPLYKDYKKVWFFYKKISRVGQSFCQVLCRSLAAHLKKKTSKIMSLKLCFYLVLCSHFCLSCLQQCIHACSHLGLVLLLSSSVSISKIRSLLRPQQPMQTWHKVCE